ncbi:MAG: hypothetical protein D6715_11150 [Calditrichaeota bacterium]|nr:MAG: hypothetical protein D6715_11150 [Calditrichota bacterium]
MKFSPEVKEENRRLRRLALMVDLTIQILAQTEELTLNEAFMHIRAARQYAVHLFPGKGEVFDLIYRPRMLRVLKERGMLPWETN